MNEGDQQLQSNRLAIRPSFVSRRGDDEEEEEEPSASEKIVVYATCVEPPARQN